MTGFTDVFGGATIYPADITYEALSLTANVELNWPTEASASSQFTARIIDVTASADGFIITVPPANQTASGQTILFNNLGAHSFLVHNNGGTQIISAPSGTVWQTYLADNSTSAGVWHSFQYGASIAAAQASALAGTGLIAIGAALSQTMPTVTFNSDYIAGNPDMGIVQVWVGTGAGQLTLPDPASVNAGWFIVARNAGGGQLTVVGTALIDAAANKIFQPGESAIICTNGVAYYTIGFGQDATFAFDYTTIAIAGTGNYTLTGSELNRIAYEFTGALTGNRTVIVPATIQQYWVTNSTTGAYTLTVRASGGSGVTITQGARGIYYCNGTDVVNADTATVSLPLSIAQGGTGATTAANARTNLGATSLGNAIFTAPDSATILALLSPISGGTF